jgi:hypothetical protein
VDPLECHPRPDFDELSRVELGSKARCKGQMRIIAFVQEPNAIKAMMKSLGLPEYRAPPPLNFKSSSVSMKFRCAVSLIEPTTTRSELKRVGQGCNCFLMIDG